MIATHQDHAHTGRPVSGHVRLRRSRSDRRLTGLCGGIAELTGSNPTTVRALFVVGAVVTLATVALGYLVLSLLVPAGD